MIVEDGENRSAIPAVVGISGRVDWALLLILSLPSIYLLLTVPPLWRDSDGFNQIASTFAPKGIIHWLPGYCLCGRLVVIVAGIAGNLLQGHGFFPIVDKHNSIKRPWSLYARRVSTPAAGVLALLFRKNGYGSSIGETFVCGIFCADTVDVCLRQLHRERSIQQSPDLSCRRFGLGLPD